MTVQIELRKHAGAGQAYSLTAFESQIGRQVQLITDQGVATVLIVAAKVDIHDGCRSALLTVEVPDEVGQFLSDPDATYKWGIHTDDSDPDVQ